MLSKFSFLKSVKHVCKIPWQQLWTLNLDQTCLLEASPTRDPDSKFLNSVRLCSGSKLKAIHTWISGNLRLRYLKLVQPCNSLVGNFLLQTSLCYPFSNDFSFWLKKGMLFGAIKTVVWIGWIQRNFRFFIFKLKCYSCKGQLEKKQQVGMSERKLNRIKLESSGRSWKVRAEIGKWL